MPHPDPPPSPRRPIVGVMGSGTEPHVDRARPLGEWLARRDVHLLTGGGGGVMTSVSQAFYETTPRAGLVIGVLPAHDANDPNPLVGYPNRWVEIPIHTHLHLSGVEGTDPRSRNHINVLSSSAVVVLPGGAGTRSEAELCVRYEIPAVAFRDAAGGAELPAGIAVCPTLDELIHALEPHLGST